MKVVKQQIGPTFGERVLDAALSVPKGRVTTYGHIARASGGGGQSARSVSGILGRYAQKGVKNIPWHRIVYANGTIWINDEHYRQRMKLYKQEGIEVDKKGKIINFNDIVYTFD